MVRVKWFVGVALHGINWNENLFHFVLRQILCHITIIQIPQFKLPPKKIIVEITGDPILRHRAAEIPLDKITSSEIFNLIKQMKKVLRGYNLVGIAAPQIGIASRIIVMEASEQLKEKYPAAVYKARGCEILPMTVSD